MSVGPHFQTLPAAEVAEDFAALCSDVAMNRGRVQVISPGGSCDCVLISKVELDSLENALQIMGDSEAGREIADALSHIARIVEPTATAAV
jgi:hypothetical protein